MGVVGIRRVRGAFVLALACLLLPEMARAANPRVGARAAVVMDARTGELLWSKNPDDHRAPASTTKILTTMLALESGRLDERFRVSSRAQAQAPSKLYLRAGQTLSLDDLTYALMLKSANDAAVVVAEGLGGSVEKFAGTMNARARRAGAGASNFRNPHGLPDRRHLSTARDLGLILRAALATPGFREVAGTTSRSLALESRGRIRKVGVQTKNRLLRGWRVRVIGKTGYTRAAGRCFAGAARLPDGREVIVVVLGAPDMWGDIRTLVAWSLDAKSDAVPTGPRLQTASARGHEKQVGAVARRSGRASRRPPVPAVQVAVLPPARPAPEQAARKASVSVKAPPRIVVNPRPQELAVRSVSPNPRPATVAVRTTTNPRVEPAVARSRPATVTARLPAAGQSATRGVVRVAYAPVVAADAAVRRGCTGRDCQEWLRYGRLTR